MRRHRCTAHGLYDGNVCPSCALIAEITARAEAAEALVAWLTPSWRAWRKAARLANRELSNLEYGHPVQTPNETVPDILLTIAERMAPIIEAKRQEIDRVYAAQERGQRRDDFDDYLDDIGGASGYSRAAKYEDRARGAEDDAATLARLESELKELTRQAKD